MDSFPSRDLYTVVRIASKFSYLRSVECGRCLSSLGSGHFPVCLQFYYYEYYFLHLQDIFHNAAYRHPSS